MKEEREYQVAIWFITIVWLLVWASIAYIAFTEKRVTIGGTYGQRAAHFEGEGAVWAGFIALAAAIGFPGWVVSQRWRFRRLFLLLLGLGWFGSVVAHFLWP